NVPARRNFLKSNPVETRHIIDEFQRAALSHPEISFSLFQNDMEVYNLPAGKLSQRIVGLFGKQYKEQLITCREETDHIVIKGYIGKPEHAKRTKGEQFFFVNNRYIRNSYLNHAILNAYEGLLPEDSYPFYVLFIEIDPVHIDINVHPTKTEIKFDDERTIYGVIRSAVKQALGAHNVVPTLDFSFDVNFAENWKNDTSKNTELSRENSYKTFSTPSFKKQDVSGWEQMFERKGTDVDFETSHLKNEENEKELLTFSSKANRSDKRDTFEPVLESEDTGVTFQVGLAYVVVQMSTGMLLLDQQASHERVLYEKYKRQLQNSSGASQQCLFPQSIDLSPPDFALVMDLKEELTNLGFLVAEFGNSSIVINGVPADITINNEKALFEGLLEQFKNFKSELSLDKRENLARSLARKASLKRGAKLDSQEMETLVG